MQENSARFVLVVQLVGMTINHSEADYSNRVPRSHDFFVYIYCIVYIMYIASLFTKKMFFSIQIDHTFF